MENIAILIYDESLLGGVQKVTFYLAELMKQHHLPIKCVISLKNEGYMKYEYSIPIHTIDVDADGKKLYDLIERYELGNIIIQVENLKVLYPKMVQIEKAGCRVIPILHSTPYYWIKKYYDVKQYLNSPRFVYQFFKMKFYWKPLHLKLFKRISCKFGWICVSHNAKVEMSRILDSSIDEQLSYIYNPIISNVSFNETVKNNTIVYAGRLSIEKRVILMLKMWKELELSFPEWSFIILGDGPQKDDMEKYINKHNLKKVTLLGTVNNVEYYFSKSKISVLFSKYEGLPTSLLEAGLNNNALVCSDSDGGAVDIVTDGLNGFVIDVNNFDLLIKQMGILMDNNGTVALEMGNNNKKALKKFSNDEIINSWKLLLGE